MPCIVCSNLVSLSIGRIYQWAVLYVEYGLNLMVMWDSHDMWTRYKCWSQRRSLFGLTSLHTWRNISPTLLWRDLE